MGNVYIEQTMVSPAVAERMLGTNIKNRPINKNIVTSYANAMRRGEWKDCIGSLSFDEHGHLIDGQHRLLAIIESGITAKFVCVHNLPEESFAAFDCGYRRKASQVLAMDDVTSSVVVASMIQTVVMLRKGWQQPRRSVSAKLTIKQVVDEYRTNPDLYNQCALIVGRLRHYAANAFGVNSSWGGLRYYLICDKEYSEGSVDNFFDNIVTLETVANPTLNALRKWLLGNPPQRRNDSVRFKILIKGWNAYATGRTISLFRIGENEKVTII